MDEFKIIPDAPNYEINREGVVRNRKTGATRKLSSGRQVGLYTTVGKPIYRSPKVLAAKIFKLPTPKQRHAPVPVTLSKDDRKLSFKNIVTAAEWLENEVLHSFEHIKDLMHKRKPEIYGWNVTYGNC